MYICTYVPIHIANKHFAITYKYMRAFIYTITHTFINYTGTYLHTDTVQYTHMQTSNTLTVSQLFCTSIQTYALTYTKILTKLPTKKQSVYTYMYTSILAYDTLTRFDITITKVKFSYIHTYIQTYTHIHKTHTHKHAHRV
jgi:hypothetical protein